MEYAGWIGIRSFAIARGTPKAEFGGFFWIVCGILECRGNTLQPNTSTFPSESNEKTMAEVDDWDRKGLPLHFGCFGTCRIDDIVVFLCVDEDSSGPAI